MTTREWSLEAARAILPDVRARTGRTVEVVEALLNDLGSAVPGAARDELEARIASELSRWAREVEALGAQAGEGWSVRFEFGEGGEGAFSWRWPESELSYFEQDEPGGSPGFGGRIRIQ